MTTPPSLMDDYLPTFDVSDSVAAIVNADPATTWSYLMDADLMEVGRRRPLVGTLNLLRALPAVFGQLLRGEVPARPPVRLLFRDLAHLPQASGGWILLGERERDEIAFGLVGRFWRPVIPFAPVHRDDFRDFSLPGYAKTIYSLRVHPLFGGRTLLTATMRTATTDASARRWFRRYWTFGVGSGAHVLAQGVIDLVKEAAEQRQQQTSLFADA